MTDQTGADDALKSSKAHSTKPFSESGKLCPAVAMVSRISLSAEKRLLSLLGGGVCLHHKLQGRCKLNRTKQNSKSLKT